MKVCDNLIQLNVHPRTTTLLNVCSAGHKQSFYVVPANARLSWSLENRQQSPTMLPSHVPIISQYDMIFHG